MNDRILLVDDDPNLLKSITRQLGGSFHLDTAASAAEALGKIEQNGAYALLVTDLQMPGMDGIALLEEVWRMWPDTVTMMLTGHADRDKVIQAINEGHLFRFLEKPCTSQLLAKAFTDGLEQHRRVWAARELHGAQRLKESYKNVIVGFGQIVEIRDPYTAGHQRRVAALATRLAGDLGLGSETVEAVQLASLIHDIGKIYVPAEFLNRPGRLRDIEFDVIKMHPRVGYDILKPLDVDLPISEFVYQHHERLDGSGYPRGLVGDDIHPEARIMAVADVVEAMGSHRPYRPALGLDAALAEITRGRGAIYDPVVVDACLALFAQGGEDLLAGL